MLKTTREHLLRFTNMHVRKLIKRNFINKKKAEIQTLKKIGIQWKYIIINYYYCWGGAGRSKLKLRDVGKKKRKKGLKGKKIYLL